MPNRATCIKTSPRLQCPCHCMNTFHWLLWSWHLLGKSSVRVSGRRPLHSLGKKFTFTL